MSEITTIHVALGRGEKKSADDLLPLVYEELRRLAAIKISQEAGGISLQGTELVHEAYLRLVDTEQVQSWDSRGHFFAAAAEAMRRILVERARQKNCLKRGGDLNRVELKEADLSDKQSAELLGLDSALEQLKMHDAEVYQLVMLRYFAGLGHQEAAQSMGISRRAADRMWALARVWLHEQVLQC